MLRHARHERIWGTHPLVIHPDTPSRNVASVSVELRSASRHTLTLRYCIEPAATLRLPDHATGPVDGLWRGTCFELFVKPVGGSAYREFNFAPVGGWAAYAFGDRRSGMTPLELDRPPHMLDGRDRNRAPEYPAVYRLDATIDRDSWPRGAARIGLCAVIEETDGTKSYWALAHPPGTPDFHHPDCFALELPAADRP